MKGKIPKILSVALALVLVLSFSLVTAVPVAATPANYPQFITIDKSVGLTAAAWSTTQKKSGTYGYHVTLPADASAKGIDVIHKNIYGTAGVGTLTLADITTLHFYESVITDGDTSNMGAGISLFFDMNDDGDWDWTNDAQIVFESPDVSGDEAGGFLLRDVDAGTYHGFEMGGGIIGDASCANLAYWQATAYATKVVLWVSIDVGWGAYNNYDGYFDDIIINTTTYELDPALIVSSVGAELPTVADGGSFYIHMTSPAVNSQPAVADTLDVTLKIYDGAALNTGAAPVSTAAYTATETGKDTSEFWADAIDTDDLDVLPGYKLSSSGVDRFVRAEISFDKTYYDIGESMTITVKDDTANISAIAINDLSDIANAEIGWWDTATTTWTGLTAANFVETGVDTGVFTYTTTPSAEGFAVGQTMEIYYGNPIYLTTDTPDNIDVSDNSSKVTNGSDEEVKATAAVLLKSDSSVAFGKGTYSASATSATITVTDKDKNTAAGTKQTISGNPVVVENITTGDSVTIASLTETGVNTGAFSATIVFGTGTGKLPIHDGDQLKVTYTDPADPEDVSTALAAVGYTVELYNASDVLVNSYTTITAAEAAVAGNDYTILVKSGYASSDEAWPVAINTAKTGLTIKADGAGVVLSRATAGDLFDVTDTYLTIEGFTLRNTLATASQGNLIDVVAAANNLTVKDCTFDLTAGYADDHGINIGTAMNTTTITGCSFNVGSRAYGIVDTTNEVKFTVKDSSFSGTDCTLAGSGWGIQITGAPVAVNDFLVQNCTFDSLAEAIDINSTAGNVTIRWNTISNSTVATKGAIDIHTANPNVLIYGNSIEDNAGYPLYVESTSSPANVELVFNNITGNAKGVNNNKTGTTLNAKHNWWGTTDGPSATDTTGAGTTTTTYYLTAPVKLTASYNETALATQNFEVATGVVVNESTATQPVGAAEYTESPKTALADASFYDVFINSTMGATDTVTIYFYTPEISGDSVAYFWNDLAGTWDACSNQGFNSYEGYIWVLAKDQTVTVPTYPTIQELTGSMFAISTVPAITLQSIAASPASVTLAVDETQQLTVTATYSDDSTADVTASSDCTYVSDDTAVATVTSPGGGLITGVADGSATVTVSYETKTDTVSVTVSAFDPMDYDEDGDGVISKNEATTAVVDYFDGTITKDQALEVIVEYMG